MDQRHAYNTYINPELGRLLKSIRLDKRFVHGEGTVLTDEQDRRYLDFVAGYGAVPFGHNPDFIWGAVDRLRRSGEPALVQPSCLNAAAELGERLIELAPPELKYCCFANSGAEAVEAAIKACRAATGRRRIISTANSFHGKTLAALSATGSADYQEAFGAPAAGFVHVPYGDATAMAEALDAAAGDAAAVILEPVQGEGGVVVPPPEYLHEVRRLCDEYGALLIVDEVQTGLGRTGRLFAVEHSGVRPDCLTLAKALGGGVVPVGACLLGEAAWSEAFALKHSSTFAGNTLACRVGLAVLDRLTGDNGALLEHVRARGAQLARGHRALVEQFPGVLREGRGVGLMNALEFAVDRHCYPSEWGTFLGILGEQNNLLPLLASYLLNVEGVRSAPTLNQSAALRVQPPLTVSESECEHYLQAMERTVALVAQGNTGELAAHLVPDKQAATTPRLPTHRRRRAVTPRNTADEGRFAFLVHPIDENSYTEFDESLCTYTPAQLAFLGEELCGHLEPFHIASTRIRSETGAEAFGDFIVIPRSARDLTAMPAPEAAELVRRGVHIARERGAGIVGLGGYTSVVTRGGSRVLNEDVAITTGNSYTVVTAMQAVELAARRLGLDLSRARVAIVGAGGTIGAATARLLADKIGRLSLIGNPANPAKTRRRFTAVIEHALAGIQPGGGTGELARRFFDSHDAAQRADPDALRRTAERLVEHPGDPLPVDWSTDPAAVLPHCQIVIVATNCPDRFIEPHMPAPGAVICDLSRPSNISYAVAENRPDVLVIDGGVVEVPGRPDLGLNFGFPRGLAYACMAETMMLGLEQCYRHTSTGNDLNRDSMALAERMAERHGFRLSGLRSFDRVLSDIDWRWLLAKRDGGGTAQRPADRTHILPAREAIDSLDRQATANAVDYLVTRHTGERGSHTALIDSDDGASLTYDELAARIQKTAAGLQREGLAGGDTCAVLAHDSIDMVVLMLAGMHQGITVVVLNAFLPPHELPHYLEQARPRVVFTAAAFAETHAPAIAGSGAAHRVLEQWCRSQEPPAQPLEPAPIPAGTPAVGLFSSGSTGRPKAVLHSHRDIINTNLNYVAGVLNLTGADVTFSPSKLFFAYGFNSVHYALFAGGTAVLAPERVRAPALLDIVRRYSPTVFFSVPTVYGLILREAAAPDTFAGVRLCVSAGETLPEEIFDAWERRFGARIIDGIGTTEVMSTFISNRPDELRPGSTGRIVPGFQVRLLNNAGGHAAPGEIGTLWVRGNTLPEGYWNDPDTTGGAFEDGWFCTNDMFYRDSRGWFYFVGRANDMLKVGGCWVSPFAIEQTLARHDSVDECVVVAKTEIGKLVRPLAYVVLKSGCTASEELVATLKEYARTHLTRHQYPHFIEFVPELPKTSSGKVLRRQLQQRGAGQTGAAPTAAGTESRLLENA